jgi:branched-chain amino acid transport system ATP-binding protein
MTRLRVQKLTRRFGGLVAIDDVSFAVPAEGITAIIGPNGAGKTTLFHLVSGQVPPSSGAVVFDGEDVTRRPPYEMACRGLARTFQTNNLFLQLTVFENVRLAVQQRMHDARAWFKPWWSFDRINQRTEQVLERAGLASRSEVLATNLSYGEQRQLEMAIALAGEPKLLLLDEPTAGMSVAETAHAVQTIGTLPRSLTLLIIEHDMDTIFALADRITVLDHGTVIAEGTPDEVRGDANVRAVYLGEE